MAVMAAMAVRQVVVRSERWRLSYLVFDADSAEESRRRNVAATVKEEELASGVMRARGRGR